MTIGRALFERWPREREARRTRRPSLVIVGLLLICLAILGAFPNAHPQSTRASQTTASPRAPEQEFANAGPVWTNITNSAGFIPNDFNSPAMAYDAADGYLVLLQSEIAHNSCCGVDTWKFSAGSWTNITGAGASPGVREGSRMVYDAADGYIVLFGDGEGCTQHGCGDTWKFVGGSWTNITTSTGPPPRIREAMAYDAADGYVVLFGGYGCTDGKCGDTWKFVGGSWTNITTSTGPPSRGFADMTYDSADGYVILFGGYGSTAALADTWKFLGGSWTNITTSTGPPSSAYPMTYDAADGYVVLLVQKALSSDTWKFSTGTWTNITTTVGSGPPPRADPGIDYDIPDGYVVLFGGEFLGDTWRFSSSLTPPAFDFSLASPSPSSLTVVQGGTSFTSSIDANLVGSATTGVTFSASGLPTGVTATFTNNPCSPTCTVTVSFSATVTATLGTTAVGIDASGGGASHSKTLSLTVQALTVGCIPPASGLVSWWPGDGNADDIIGSNPGTLEGGATFAPGLVGQAFSFNGVDGAVETTATDVMNRLPFTVDAWVNPSLRSDGTDFPNNAISNDNPGLYGNGFGVNVFPGGSQLKVEFEDGFRAVPGVSFNAGQWYQIAVVYTSGNYKAYVNGQLVDDFNFNQGAPDGVNFVRIGKHNNDVGTYGTRRFFNGLIDEVQIFNSSLTASEIQSIFNAGSGGVCKLSPPPATTWTQLFLPSSPPQRGFASMAYDGADGYVLLFGGTNSSGQYVADTWKFQAGAWTQLSTSSSPPPRGYASMAYDAADGYVLLFGGASSTSYLGDTWKFQAGTWTQLSTSSSPSPRYGIASMAYDAADGYVLLFGGQNSTSVLGDTWEFKAGSWTQLSTSSSPPARAYASMAYDAADGYVLLFGGAGSTSYLGDTWKFQAGTWTQLSTYSSPPPRGSSSMAYDAADGYVLLFGGQNSTSVLGDTWEFKAGSWTQLSTSSSPPARRAASMAYDAADRYVLLFGGLNSTSVTVLGDTWKFGPPPLVGAFDFRLSTPSPSSLTIVQGSTSPASSIDAALVSGTTSAVSFSALGLPTGVTAAFTNNPCNPACTMTVSFSATSTAALGTATVSIDASGGGVSHSTSLSLTVAAPPFDFSISTPSPSSLTVVQASTSPSSSIDATMVSGTTAEVTFSASGLPTGVTAIFTNSPCSPACTVTVSFSATATAILGTTIVSIDASGGGASHSTTLSLTVQAPVVRVPSVMVNSPRPNPANTGATVNVTFSVFSAATVTGIIVDWGDGTTADSLPGTATSDTHVYANTGNLKSEAFTITVAASNSAGPGSASTTETVNDLPPVGSNTNVSPNPAMVNQPVTVTFTVTDPDGTVTGITVSWGDSSTPDALAGTATTDTHTYASGGSFTITVAATDNSGSVSSVELSETVTSVTTTPVKLTFQGFNLDDFDNGVGQLQVFVNGHQVVDIPAGLNHLTGTGDYAPYTNRWVSFGPFDITSFVVQGQNTIVFMSPSPGHFGLVKNVTITQGDSTLLHVRGARHVSLTHSVTFTFSNPPTTTRFTVSNPSRRRDGDRRPDGDVHPKERTDREIPIPSKSS